MSVNRTTWILVLTVGLAIPWALVAQSTNPRARMAECVNTLYQKGDLNEIDINRELDPLFFHVGFMVRDTGERIFYAMPRFIILRPGHLGGQIRFTLSFGQEESGSFLGGRFKIRFGEFKTVVFDANLERLRRGGYLVDADAQPVFRLFASGEQQVSFDVPPGEEEIFFEAQAPVGGLFFIRDVYFSASAMNNLNEPSSTVAKAPTAQAPKAPTAPAPKAPTAPAALGVGAPSEEDTIKQIKAVLGRYQTALDQFCGHVERAAQKKSGHPKFIEALRSDEKKFEAVRKDLKTLLDNPGGYEW